ncbi:MAG: hypothetical protein R3B54_03720 [Bdellovibrionota bacterium]
MCGIAGSIGLSNALALPLVNEMSSALRHRGPDDIGVQSIQNETASVVLGHTRLSILDLSPGGHQPMSDSSATGGDKNWLTYNGEILPRRTR